MTAIKSLFLSLPDVYEALYVSVSSPTATSSSSNHPSLPANRARDTLTDEARRAIATGL